MRIDFIGAGSGARTIGRDLINAGHDSIVSNSQ